MTLRTSTRAVVVFSLLGFSLLGSWACGGGNPGRVSTDGADAGAITLIASGGLSGSVTADVAFDEPGVGPQLTCAAPLNAGACQLTSCQVGGIGDPGMGYGNFGPMFATVGTTTVPLTYNGFGYPTVGFPASIALGTGGVMTFHGGNGASLPTFDVSATIPDLAVITSPVASNGGAAIIDTTQDLSVTWIPIRIGQIHFQIENGVPSGGNVELAVRCTFEGASGSGVVSQTLLSALKAMSAAMPLTAALTSELDATTVVDGLRLVTNSYQSSPTTGHAFDVTLQ